MDLDTTRRTDRSDIAGAAHSSAAAFFDDPVPSLPDGPSVWPMWRDARRAT